ncbi:cytochrome P450 CYP82D47-like [Durio zibethinus]|uniref:Cytochrome P450 CYP82D47-like n=1 Tax=Durio zibethinus TaxID=66656 RepID=A0A6P6AYF6_DURZI|nr:cytochrome P450 CYP82D47-like [Durio zibethinus]
MDLCTHFQAIAWLLGLLLFCSLLRRHNKSKGTILLAPEPSGALPLIGHLHLLGGQSTPARTWRAMADKYGPVFTFRLGQQRALVISSHEAVKDCFTTNDKILASRPRSTAGKYLGYNYAAMGFAPYGAYWRDIRKLAVAELLSSRILEALKHVRISNVDAFIRKLYSFCQRNEKNPNNKVDISYRLELLTINIILQMIAGKRYFSCAEGKDDAEAQHAVKTIKELFYFAGNFAPADVIPVLEWIDFQGQVKSMKRVSKELDSIIEGWVRERKLKRHDMGEADNNQDFLDVLLSKVTEESIFGHPRDTIIKATVMNLIIAAADTTSITLTWILSNLMNNERALKRAQEELDSKIGRERWVEDSDMEKLSYLQAIVKETLRLYPPGPLSVPHEAMEDCCVGGYHIPKGTLLFVNLWKLHRDPRIWSNPEEFLPERFLSSHVNVDVFGKHFEYIPFGSGRRSCPGISMAMQVTRLTIARLLQGFDLTTPLNMPADMTEGLGLTMPKATPLEVIPTPRLSAKLYDQL